MRRPGLHDDGKQQGGHSQEDGDDLLVPHEIAKEPDGQRQGPGQFAHDVKGEEDEGRAKIFLEIFDDPLFCDAEDRDSEEDYDRKGRGGP